MSHQLSYCTNTPFIKKCDGFKLDTGGLGYESSYVFNTKIFQYEYTPDFNKTSGSHQLSLCCPSSIAQACLGLNIDDSGISPYISFGINAGSAEYQYKSSIDALRTENCTTTISNGVIENDRITGGTLTTVCPDSKSTLEIRNLEDLTFERLDNVLNQLNKKLDNTQIKIEQTMKNIGVSSGDQMPIANAMNINQNWTIYDILAKMKENGIVVTTNSLKKQGKWYKNGNEFFPDCCKIAFECGYYIDYHIENKIDYCRICSQKFRLEYFLETV
jgi:hypothetical protein